MWLFLFYINDISSSVFLWRCFWSFTKCVLVYLYRWLHFVKVGVVISVFLNYYGLKPFPPPFIYNSTFIFNNTERPSLILLSFLKSLHAWETKTLRCRSFCKYLYVILTTCSCKECNMYPRPWYGSQVSPSIVHGPYHGSRKRE